MMISIIIPTLNEVERIATHIEKLRASRVESEIIVVDGGSTDGTQDIVRATNTRLVITQAGRGNQLNVGVQHTSGEIILFMHADSQFTHDGLFYLQQILSENPTIIGGNFYTRFNNESSHASWIETFYQRARKHGYYYGDSGIFIRRSVLNELGGVRPLPIMEDYDLVKRMEKHPLPTTEINDTSVVTSSRRFCGRSRLGIIFGWVLMHILYANNAPSWLLERIYDTRRQRKSNHSVSITRILAKQKKPDHKNHALSKHL